jgi:hypothetical protein
MVRELESTYENVASRHVVSLVNRLIRFAQPSGEPTSQTLLEVLKTEQVQRLAGLSKTIRWVRALRRREEGWNGYDALPPAPDAIRHAESWVRQYFCEVADAGYTWAHPHVTSSADGEVVFEWQNGERELTVYISPETAFYVRSAENEHQLDTLEGDASSATIRRQLWNWLVG